MAAKAGDGTGMEQMKGEQGLTSNEGATATTAERPGVGAKLAGGNRQAPAK